MMMQRMLQLRLSQILLYLALIILTALIILDFTSEKSDPSGNLVQAASSWRNCIDSRHISMLGCRPIDIFHAINTNHDFTVNWNEFEHFSTDLSINEDVRYNHESYLAAMLTANAFVTYDMYM